MNILIAIAVITALIAVAVLIHSKFQQETLTREQYAFKCLAAIISLVTVAIAAISSREGLIDQIFSLFATVIGYPQTPPQPAPLSEKTLVVILVAFAIYLINQSHSDWNGQISADESNRTRMKRSTSLLQQAMDEASRLAKRRGTRSLFHETKRIDPVSTPEDPNLIWHDHVRELFQLWMPHAAFTLTEGLSWIPQMRCWKGTDKALKRHLFILCNKDRPNETLLQEFREYAELSAGTRNISLYAVYRDINAQYDTNGTNETFSGLTLLSEEFLYQSIIDFSDYFSDLIQRVEKETFPSTTIAIQDLYTSSAISSDVAGRNIVSDDLSDYLTRWSEQPAGQQIAILGDYGQGKSTAALMFAYQTAKQCQTNNEKRIPILLELRGKSPANLSAHELLAAWGQRYNYHASALMKLLISGRLILILEGFDEMSNISSAEARIAHFRSLWRFAYPKNKIIFTGRRNLFFEDRELQIVLKGGENGSGNRFCETLHLRPFDRTKVANSLRWTDQGTISEILHAADTNIQIRDIISRPSLLFIVASMWNELRLLLAQGQITSAFVIDRFILHSYERQQEKERDLNFMRLTTTERRFFNEGIAAYMASQDATNQITSTDLRAAVERLYIAYPENSHISESVVLETNSQPLKERMKDRDEAIEAITTDVRTHGILVSDVSQRDAFRFAHKSFYELLAAKVHAYDLLEINPVFYKTIGDAVDGDTKHAEKRPETLRFFSEIVSSHLQPAHRNDELPGRLYDLIFGGSKHHFVIRLWFRAIQLASLRFIHNSRLRMSSFILLNSIVFLNAIWSTETVRAFMAANSYLAPYRSTSPKTDVTQFGTVALIIFICLITFFKFWSEVLRRRSKLWAAVLLITDKSQRTTTGTRALQNFLGQRASKELIKKVSEEYNI